MKGRRECLSLRSNHGEETEVGFNHRKGEVELGFTYMAIPRDRREGGKEELLCCGEECWKCQEEKHNFRRESRNSCSERKKGREG